jgi:hypothetical protein
MSEKNKAAVGRWFAVLGRECKSLLTVGQMTGWVSHCAWGNRSSNLSSLTG